MGVEVCHGPDQIPYRYKDASMLRSAPSVFQFKCVFIKGFGWFRFFARPLLIKRVRP